MSVDTRSCDHDASFFKTFQTHKNSHVMIIMFTSNDNSHYDKVMQPILFSPFSLRELYFFLSSSLHYFLRKRYFLNRMYCTLTIVRLPP